MFVSSSSSSSSCYVVLVLRRRAEYWTDRAEIFTEHSPDMVVMQIGCTVSPVVALQDSKIDLGFHGFHYMCYIVLQYLYSFFNSKNVSPGVFLGAVFEKDIQNWGKFLGANRGPETKK